VFHLAELRRINLGFTVFWVRCLGHMLFALPLQCDYVTVSEACMVARRFLCIQSFCYSVSAAEKKTFASSYTMVESRQRRARVMAAHAMLVCVLGRVRCFGSASHIALAVMSWKRERLAGQSDSQLQGRN